jgi:hypothetical protein
MADLTSQLTQLAQLKNDGVLSEEESQAAKAKLLGTATGVTSDAPQRWQREICTVQYVPVKSRWNSSDSQFRAVATGPSGRYVVAQSPVWNDSNGRSEEENLKQYHAALEAILKDLSAGGWQVVEQFRLPRYASDVP